MDKKLKKFLKTLKINESAISTVFGGIVVIIIAVMIFNYFKSFNKGKVTESAPVDVTQQTENGGVTVNVEEDGTKVPQGLPTTYKVVLGDSLWKIAEKHYGSGYNWVDIAKENNLVKPDSLNVGMELQIPKTAVREPITANAQINASGGSKTLESDKYLTVKGDYLWEIAIKAYGDGYAWTKIYQNNKEKIGDNPNRLPIGIELSLPR